jgi:membrane protease YdiL (CAAX protease family)
VTHARTVAAAEILLCSGVPTQILITFGLALAGFPIPEEPTVASVAAILLIDTIVVITLMVLFTRAAGQTPREIWLGPRRAAREGVLGIALVPVVFALVLVLLTTLRLAVPALRNVPENPLEALARQGSYQSVLFGFVVIVSGGVREELQRAFMLRRFEDHLGGGTAGVIVVSVAFGIGHFQQGWDAVVTTGILGAFWAVLYRRRRSTVAPIVSHAGYNALEVALVALRG